MKHLRAVAAVSWLSLLAALPAGAAMEDYCQVPPYVIQNVAPNVMVVMDNSGSMFNFAYHDGYDTVDPSDDNMCTSSGNPCDAFDPNHQYYGYFNSNAWYSYSSNRFVETALKSARGKNASEWDGNFLNWLTMRRIDVMRKVLTGGKTTSGEGSGYSRLVGEQPDYWGRGIYKRVANIENYADATDFTGTRCISFSSGGSSTPKFYVRSGSSCGSSNDGTYYVQVRVPDPVEGVLQQVVGTKARVGLAHYNVNSTTPQGGRIEESITNTSYTDTINKINNDRPDSNTPLAETLWTVTGYFAQQATMEGGPGPRYNNGDYWTNNNNDPMNYGTGGQPLYLECAQNFVLYITDGEPCADGYLPSTLKDYADGRSSYDCDDGSPGNPGRDGYCPAVGSFPASTFPSCYGGGQGGYVAGLEDVALYAHTNDLRSDIAGEQVLNLYTIFAFGKGSTLLKYASINGGFEDLNGNGEPDQQAEWDNNGDGEPDTYYEATEGSELEDAVRAAFSSILKRVSSGTAASVLASGEGSGANLVQAVFYPRRRFGNTMVGWTGMMQNLWYYVDPFFTNSTIREDTNSTKKLELDQDYILSLYFDQDQQEAMAKKYASDQYGNRGSLVETVPFEDLSNLWEAGELLWKRDLSVNPRTIYTTVDGTTLYDFSTANAATLASWLDAQDRNGDLSTVDDAEYIIRYVQGEDFPGVDRDGDGADDFRSRTVTVGGETHVWKLGDIINSTPRIVSWYPLNRYHKDYNDSTYGPCDDPTHQCPDPVQSDPADETHFTTTQAYKDRNMIFVGSNDGMLHAFRMGTLRLKWSGQSDEQAWLDGTDLGEEVWAFIPRQVLPYLRYQMEKDYCHVYSVDLTPFVFDASIGGAPTAQRVQSATQSSWRTVLIGGMRTGGASRDASASCSDCVKTPIAGVGYSSYFALDITDPENPSLLWEFTDPELGFATTGPAVIRVAAGSGAAPDDTNGYWYVVFASGPTGPISASGYQFMGRSDQNLKLFVLDLKTGALQRVIDTGVRYAFAGSISNGTNDVDTNYQDEALYVGYVKRQRVGSEYYWTDGGIGRLVTHEDPDPGNWTWSTVMDGAGPVTAGIARLRDVTQDRLWLLGGTGRYYYSLDTEQDDPDGQRHIFAFKEPCYVPNTGFDDTCTTSVNFNLLDDRTVLPPSPGEPSVGWKIQLDPDGSYTYDEGDPPAPVTRDYLAERLVSNPFVSSAGCAFFPTFQPYNSECAIGGKSFIWFTDYKTGGLGEACKGRVTVQLSSGAIEEIQVPEDGSSGRKSMALEGQPPEGEGGVLQSGAEPVQRILLKRRQ